MINITIPEYVNNYKLIMLRETICIKTLSIEKQFHTILVSCSCKYNICEKLYPSKWPIQSKQNITTRKNQWDI